MPFRQGVETHGSQSVGERKAETCRVVVMVLRTSSDPFTRRYVRPGSSSFATSASANIWRVKGQLDYHSHYGRT